uniref:GGDEF domain-containing protein n=1 Tax=Oceanispirochaeta sp. TaxID=2035350 RepID=UPI0026189BE8
MIEESNILGPKFKNIKQADSHCNFSLINQIISVRPNPTEIRSCLINCSALDKENPENDSLLILTDITEQVKIREELSQSNKALVELANIDSLTQISNRRKFNDVLKAEWNRSRRNQRSMSLIMMDVDLFKKYNDNYGHQAGDVCLQTIAATINQLVQRKGDLFCRIGGEEFAVIMPETERGGAAVLAEKLCSSIEDLKIPHEKSEISDWVTISLGVAEFKCGLNMRSEDLYRLADE